MSQSIPVFAQLGLLQGVFKDQAKKRRAQELTANLSDRNKAATEEIRGKRPDLFPGEEETQNRRRKTVSSPNVTRGGALVPQGAIQQKSLLG